VLKGARAFDVIGCVRGGPVRAGPRPVPLRVQHWLQAMLLEEMIQRSVLTLAQARRSS
jgi:hypothetical protein